MTTPNDNQSTPPEQTPHESAERNPFDFSGQGGGLDGLGLEGLGLEGLGDAGVDTGLAPDPAILDRNLVALCARNRALAQRVASSSSRAGASFEVSADGGVTGALDGRRLGSKRRVLSEAGVLADAIDPAECATACVIGFGLGHHVSALHDRMGSKSLVVVYEPDVALLRSVLERVDHSAWLAQGRCVIATDAQDAAGLTRLIQGFEGIVSLGVKIVEHGPSRARIGDASAAFGRTVSEVVRATRTGVVTTLVHAPVSLRNMTMNADRYASCAGIDALRDSCMGRIAVMVSAGPSLQRNLAVLGDPSVRERVVVIAVQTVLKPMLSAGIKPDFVTALDHHELSGRFYEGLTPEDVEGVRLVVEPKANAAIMERFPGEVLVIREPMLDLLIGEELARPMDELPAGATVAHLSYYLARYLGCDPVVMIGQDLGFTDGQYYASGAAIHQVWQGELNPDRTLEMLEWERVARMRANLRKVDGLHGSIYVDEQMTTYLAQFEADFQKDVQQGLTVIDATEGGAIKKHAQTMPLRSALARYADRASPTIPSTMSGGRSISEIRPALRAHWQKLIGQAGEIASLSDEAADLLRQIADPSTSSAKANQVVARVQEIGERVRGITPAFRLVEFINQTGVLNRFKADRLIGLQDTDDARQRQRLQAERDIRNVEWIGAAARELERQITLAIEVLVGRRGKVTRDEAEPDGDASSDTGRDHIAIKAEQVRAEIVVLCDPHRTGLGRARDLGDPVWDGRGALELTLRRVLRATSAAGVCVLTCDATRTRALIEQGGLGEHLGGRIVIEQADPDRWAARRDAIAAARAPASDAWRGGVGQACVFDELLCPDLIGELMERRGVDAACIVGADWSLVDPVLLDAMITRHAESPKRHPVVFSQAAPGLGGCVLSAEAVETLRSLRRSGSPLNTVGGILGYIPVRPQTDPIGTPLCIPVDTSVRDLGMRVMTDIPEGTARVFAALGDRAPDASATQIARALAGCVAGWPRELIVELCSERRENGVASAWRRGGTKRVERQPVDVAALTDVFAEHVARRTDAVITIGGAGDPLMHRDVMQAIDAAVRAEPACVRLRTGLAADGFDDWWSAHALATSGLGVLSVDLFTNDAPTYAALTGLNEHEAVIERIDAIKSARIETGAGLVLPWIQARMIKCDAVLEQMDSFYDSWTMMCGSAVIESVPEWSTDRIRPIVIPERRARQIARSVLRVRCDGALCDERWEPLTGTNAWHDGLGACVGSWSEALGDSSDVRATPQTTGAGA